MIRFKIRALRLKLGKDGEPLPADAFAALLGLRGKWRGLLIYAWESGRKKPGAQSIMLMKQLADSIKRPR